MKRSRFDQLVEDALADLPARYRALVNNLAIIVQDYPDERRPRRQQPAGSELLLGEFHGIPRTEKSVFEPGPPDRIFLYRKNIEAICANDDEIREQIQLTLLHELGHYFGLAEDELEHL
jgi:predicted Zn-dependent protease with MMP-like domain